MRYGHSERAGPNQFEILSKISSVNLGETLRLVIVTPEYLDDAIAAQYFLCYLRDLSDRVLDPAAVPAKRLAEHANQGGNDRDDYHDKNKQAHTLVNHHAHGRNYRQEVAHRDRHDAGHRFGDHFDVIGHTGQHRTHRVFLDKTRRQGQEFFEDIPAQCADDAAPDPSQ